MKKTKKLLAVLLTASMVLGVCACSNTVPPNTGEKASSTEETSDGGSWEDKEITITMMHANTEESEKSVVTSAAFRQMINEFKEEHPNVTIDETIISDGYDTTMLQYAAADDLPMVFRFLYANLDTIAGGGLAADIREDVDPEMYIDKLESCTYKDGGIYGLNMKFTDYNLVYYNETMLKEATGSTEFPKTWEEYLALDEYFDSKGIDLISLGNEWKWFAVVAFLNPLIREFCGDEFLEEMIAGTGAYSWDCEEFIRAVEEAAKVAPVCNADFNSLDDMSSIGDYCAGKSFSTCYGGWVTSTIGLYAEEYPDVVNNTRVALVPSYGGTEEDSSVVFASTETYGINSKVTGDEYEACLALIQKLASKDYAIYNAERGNTAPEIVDMSTVDLSDALPMVQDFMEIHNAGHNTVKSVFTYLPTAINDQLLSDFQLVLAGSMTAEEMAKDLQSYQETYESSLK